MCDSSEVIKRLRQNLESPLKVSRKLENMNLDI